MIYRQWTQWWFHGVRGWLVESPALENLSTSSRLTRWGSLPLSLLSLLISLFFTPTITFHFFHFPIIDIIQADQVKFTFSFSLSNHWYHASWPGGVHFHFFTPTFTFSLLLFYFHFRFFTFQSLTSYMLTRLG